MTHDRKVKEIIDEFKQKIEKVCTEYGISRARAIKTLYKPKIDEEKLKTIIDEYLGDSYTAGYLAHAIAKKVGEIMK